jgi:hypothetical protein
MHTHFSRGLDFCTITIVAPRIIIKFNLDFNLYLHGNRLLEFSTLLYLEHEITTIDIFHDKVQSVLKTGNRRLFQPEKQITNE